MVPEIQGMTDSFFIVLGQFLPFDTPNKPKNQNFEKMKTSLEILSIHACVPQMTIIWCMVPEIWSAADRNGHFGLFLPFYPLGTRKLKNKSGDIIILHKCIINDNHSMYGS